MFFFSEIEFPSDEILNLSVIKLVTSLYSNLKLTRKQVQTIITLFNKFFHSSYINCNKELFTLDLKSNKIASEKFRKFHK